jgi:hypothetical protein
MLLINENYYYYMMIHLSSCDREIIIFKASKAWPLSLIQSLLMHHQIIGLCHAMYILSGLMNEYGDWPMYACATSELLGLHGTVV